MFVEYQDRYFIDENLTDEEKLFKAYYENKKDMFEGNLPADEFWDKLTDEEKVYLKFCKPLMEETLFIPAQWDVNVVPHGRYTPAFIHKHGFIEIMYVFSGNCTNHLQTRDIQMQAGDVGIIAPGTEHSICVFTDDCIVYNYLVRTSTFEKTFFSVLSSNSVLSDFFKKIIYGNEETSAEPDAFIMFRTGEDISLKRLLARIYHESRKTQAYKSEMMDALLTLFFAELVRNHENNLYMEAENERDNQMLIPIFRYMQENYKMVSLGSMAAHFHYSERHMKRVIKRYTGYSFSENILRIRMRQAGHLLEKTGMSVAEISEAVGYADESGFRYAFRQYYHMSPKQYRSRSV